MTFALLVTLAGTPRPLPRPRFIRGRAVSIASPKAKAYAQALQRAARAAVLNVGEDVVRQAFARPGGLAVTVLAEFPTSKAERWGTLHTHKPDADNIGKQIDRLAASGALGGDDCRVAHLLVVKRWAKDGRLSITVQAANNTTPLDAIGPAASLRAPPGWLK